MAQRILVGVPPKHHVLLSHDEIDGFTDLGYTCKPVPYGRNDSSAGKIKKLWGVIAKALNIVKELYAFSPDILYLNSRFEPVGTTRDFITVLIIKLFYLRRVKIVIKTHGSDVSVLQQASFFYRKLMIPFLRKHVDAWFFLSNEEKEMVRQYDEALARKIFITANIVDPGRSVASVEFREKYALDEQKFKVLFVGRIVREKGVFSLLESIPMLTCKDDCQFVFVGDGPDLEKLKKRTEALEITKFTRFPGFIPDHECDHFYANADMLAFPTYFNEGFPMALFKSVAAGLPVITTRIRAARDHLSSPDNVLWVDGESPESVAKAINTLYENHALRKTMSENNRQIAKKFSRGQVCAGMHEVMMSINHA
ncbi:glycosyltransferase family 4 protein [Niastella caeni]|uniref:Glycosyltransferase family 4 protein n=1 Tax=Niastella caeni TaxID=2569763 RepID=A0A4V4H1L6_9BACT|nr:glycosyltransferase family 4 protein [Niastella caeni]THU40966.1 glycosyltransferase family 4 protein [Niastella caeni]